MNILSFLLFSTCVAVVYPTVGGLTADKFKEEIQLKRYIDFSEIPDYEILFWPSSSIGSRSSNVKEVKAVFDVTAELRRANAKKKKKDDTTVRPLALGKITVASGTQEFVVPVTTKPIVHQKPTSVEIIAVPVTIKPNVSAKPTLAPQKNQNNSSMYTRTTPKPTITTITATKSPKPTKISGSVTNAISTQSQFNAQPSRVTPKPASQVTSRKPNIPIKVKNTTASSVAALQGVSAEPIKVTVKPVATTVKPNKQKPSESSGPCNCILGVCTCCSGPILGLLSQKACIKVIYIPEDFAFDYTLMLNNRVLYQNKISGKNPRPACIGIPRFNRIRLCARFSNIYFAGRNIHFCMGIEGRWDYEELFNLPFDCVRMGAQGFAIVKPEDGGGLEVPGGLDSIIDVGGDDIGEYDENVVRNLFYY